MSDGVAENNNDQVMRITTTVDTLEWDDDDNFTPFGGLSPNIAGGPLTGAAAFIQMSPLSATMTEEPYRLYAVVQPPIGSAAAETEPNDTTASANASGTNYFSGTLAGPAASMDLDLFRFVSRAGSLIMLNLDSDPLRDNTPINAKLELLDSGGNVLIQVNDNKAISSTTSGAGSLTAMTPNSPGEALTWRAEATGTYYARVSIGTSSTTSIGAGDYLLSISVDCLAGDSDSDGVPDAVDCAPADPSTWAVPSDPRSLLLAGSGPTALTWTSPAAPGTNAVLRYDLLRSTSRSDFSAASAICLESDDTNTTASDTSPRPPAGTGYFYLVRAENACGGNMGTSSSGVPHTGRSCP
jgi:hypothetical protein